MGQYEWDDLPRTTVPTVYLIPGRIPGHYDVIVGGDRDWTVSYIPVIHRYTGIAGASIIRWSDMKGGL